MESVHGVRVRGSFDRCAGAVAEWSCRGRVFDRDPDAPRVFAHRSTAAVTSDRSNTNGRATIDPARRARARRPKRPGGPGRTDVHLDPQPLVDQHHPDVPSACPRRSCFGPARIPASSSMSATSTAAQCRMKSRSPPSPEPGTLAGLVCDGGASGFVRRERSRSLRRNDPGTDSGTPVADRLGRRPAAVQRRPRTAWRRAMGGGRQPSFDLSSASRTSRQSAAHSSRSAAGKC